MWSKGVKPSTRGKIFLFTGMPFVAIGILGGLSTSELQVRGVLTHASLVEKYTSRVHTGERGNLHYKLRVVFTGPYGDEHEHVTEAKNQHHFETLEVGDVIDLVYGPQDPSRAALPRQLAQPWWGGALVVGVLGLPMMGIGAWILLRDRMAAAN